MNNVSYNNLAIRQKKIFTVLFILFYLAIMALFTGPYIYIAIKGPLTDGFKSFISYVIVLFFYGLIELFLVSYTAIAIIYLFKNLKYKNAVWTDENGIYLYGNTIALGFVKWEDIETMYYSKYIFFDNKRKTVVIRLKKDETSMNGMSAFMKYNRHFIKKYGGYKCFVASTFLCKGRRKDTSRMILEAWENYKQAKLGQSTTDLVVGETHNSAHYEVQKI